MDDQHSLQYFHIRDRVTGLFLRFDDNNHADWDEQHRAARLSCESARATLTMLELTQQSCFQIVRSDWSPGSERRSVRETFRDWWTAVRHFFMS